MARRLGAATDRLHALERLYAYELWHRLRELDEEIEGRELGELNAIAVKGVHDVVASLAKSATAFGLEEVCCAAERLADALAAPAADPDRARRCSREALAGLRLAVAESELGGAPAEFEPAEPAARSKRLLLAFAEDPELSGELGFQLGCFGFLVRVVDDPLEFAAALSDAAAVILDVDIHASEGKVPRVLSAVVRHRRVAVDPLPLLVLSARDDLETRLRVVRFGADAFLSRPLEVRELVEQLDALVHHPACSRYRVLLVTDDYGEALPLLLTLQTSGMEVELTIGALDALRRLNELDPDVVVANIDLMGCSGPELVAVIRQERAHADLPVVFLSRGSNLQQQLEAIRRGGDDLLPSAPTPAQLVPTVRNHAHRHRMLRHFRTRDGLTGLLNFSSVMEALRQAIRRATDEGRPLVLALLDIDGLGQLNRRLGYLAGDAVLRSLADLLHQRFRRTDVLGRYNGRFLVVLPDTALANAVKIVEETRMLFSKINHRTRDRAFNVTFSCGVARQQAGETATDLYESARAALKRAWSSGGDRLEMAAE